MATFNALYKTFSSLCSHPQPRQVIF